MEHIKLEKLLSYTEGMIGGREATELESHMAICDRCWRLFTAIKSTEENIKDLLPPAEPGKDCPEEWQLLAFIKDELEPDEAKTIKEHTEDCNHCTERLAFYHKNPVPETHPLTTPQEWREMAYRSLTVEGKPHTTAGEEKPSLLGSIYEWFTAMVSSLPPLPGYAIATVAVALLIWMGFKERVTVVTIPSSQQITYTAVPSSLAFMAGRKVERIDGMTITKKGRNLLFNWKPIDGTSGYTFSLREDDRPLIADMKTDKPVASVPLAKLKEGRLYRWLIRGETSDGRGFEYTGEFVLKR